MKNIKHSAIPLLLVAAGAAFSSTAHAADGTVSFVGKVIASTCSVDGGSDLTVPLPPVSTTALTDVGSVAGRSAFSLALKGCTVGGENPVKVGVIFENGANVDQSSGRLTIDTGAKAATGVQINVLDDQQKLIPIGAQTSASTQIADIDAEGNAKLNYFAEYYASGAVKAGDVNSRVEYSLIYQ
ncbi:fimbrial protein [Burkholderia sp. AU16741]|uniref:fimbrial protein n=1 Tax=unclassified Burkholderia TaxID=2613784 RepID=UPI000B79C45A|nr:MULTISPECIES: fimbrial protein [unclassified Burkholderia]MDN7427351.1 fimbrial protein [Burkholderia sp. AU45388]OXI30219.1 fimbrial protein [Burkholderia sp. AU16741]